MGTVGHGVIIALAASVFALACGSSRDRDRFTEGAGTDAFGTSPTTSAGCEEANAKRSSVGCEYYAVHMDGASTADNGCFAAFVANAQPNPVKVQVTFAGVDIDVATYAKIPRGSGRDLVYDDYDPTLGIPPGEVAILFLAGVPEPGKPNTKSPDEAKPARCPVAPALSSLTQAHGTARSRAFRIRTSDPVVAYQMLPYGGGSAAVTGATLLLPTSAYGTNYLAVNAYSAGPLERNGTTSMDVVASEDDTHVTIVPKVPIIAGPEVPAASAGEPVTYTLAAGEVLQITQPQELTGSPIESDRPIAVFAGQPCMNVPIEAGFCDHGEQQIPPVSALGHEYAGVLPRQRSKVVENPPWRIVGAVDGTKLSFDPPGVGPEALARGQVLEFKTGRPFVVRSQDKDHPFLLFSYMTGATTVADGYGDPDFVRSVAIAQYMKRYVFFTDPTYPETNLVVVRRRGTEGRFADVELDCRGTLDGWQPLGDGSLELTRVDLVRHDFQKQGSCDNGRHEMHSEAPFGLWVWGWGTTETTTFTAFVSYGYPAGENVATLSDVVVPAVPR